MATPNPNGNPDTFFIARVRKYMRDVPVTFRDAFTGDGVTGGTTPGAVPWRVNRPPVINPTAEVLQPGAGVLVSVNAVAQTVEYDSAVGPVAGHVNVITETGELYFGTTPPAAQAILISYQSARFSTSQILNALTEGMNQLYPELYQEDTNTTSVVLTPTTTEYGLPAIFNDPRVQILAMEVAPPAGIITYFDTGLFDAVGPNGDILQVLKAWPPGSTVRLTYNAPYQALSDVETSAMWLPVYYACSLLADMQETSRSRQTDVIPMTGEGGSKPGDGAAVSDRWMQRFLQGKQQLMRNDPVTRTLGDRAVERLPIMRSVGFQWDPF